MFLSASLERTVNNVAAALSDIQVVRKPFPHFAVAGLFDDATAEFILDLLEHDVPWTVSRRDFYVRNDFPGIIEHVKGTPAESIVAPETIHTICKHLGRIFGGNFACDHFQLLAQQMLSGYKIGIHNDAPSGNSETHRLVVNLNRGFEDTIGGHLTLLNVNDPSEDPVILRPLHNSAVGMEFSDHSWHCVDLIKSGERYSLLYSFWKEPL